MLRKDTYCIILVVLLLVGATKVSALDFWSVEGFVCSEDSYVEANDLWQPCSIDGYDFCTNQTETYEGVPITALVAFRITDDRGMTYQEFAGSSWAVGHLYARVYYEGDALWYLQNLTNWSRACTDCGCNGFVLNDSGYYLIAELGDEYIGCPAFFSATDRPEGFVWAGAGYLKPINNSCVHIRVARCVDDEDCISPDEYCERKKVSYWDLHWRNWSCQKKQCEDNQFRCLGYALYACDEHKWKSNTTAYNPKCEDRVNSTWFEWAVVDRTLTNIPPGRAPPMPSYLGEGAPEGYLATYNKEDLNNIVVDLTAGPLAALVQYAELIMVAIVLSLAVYGIMRFKK